MSHKEHANRRKFIYSLLIFSPRFSRSSTKTYIYRFRSSKTCLSPIGKSHRSKQRSNKTASATQRRHCPPTGQTCPFGSFLLQSWRFAARIALCIAHLAVAMIHRHQATRTLSRLLRLFAKPPALKNRPLEQQHRDVRFLTPLGVKSARLRLSGSRRAFRLLSPANRWSSASPCTAASTSSCVSSAWVT